jgi:hypothetical protein
LTPDASRCQECHRLWGNYFCSVIDLVRLKRLIYFIEVGQEKGSIEALSDWLARTTIANDSFRQLIRQHEKVHLKRAVAAQSPSSL